MNCIQGQHMVVLLLLPMSPNRCYRCCQYIQSAFGEVMGTPAWKTLPSWYLVATNDQAIPPDAERFFAQRMGATTVEITSSHVPMVSYPKEVTKLIETAAEAVKVTP